MHCEYAGICSGCLEIEQTYSSQIEKKKSLLKNLFPQFSEEQIQLQSFGEGGFRSRLDFVLDHGSFGLYSHKTKKIEQLNQCPQLTPELERLFQNFQKLPWPALKGSFRLRVGPQNQTGAWLDFANVDIQRILKDTALMNSLTGLATVEMGQKHKIVFRKNDDSWGIREPEFHPWSETLLNEKRLSLFSTVAAFTQPSHVSNAWIVKKISDWVKDLKPATILEFGAGIGNLTFPSLWSPKTHLTALELDPLSAQALKINLNEHNCEAQVTVLQGDFRRSQQPLMSTYDLLLLNPARNGIGDLAQNLLKQKLPDSIIYMSCFPESLKKDSQSFEKHYSLAELWVVDQFPQTPHMEVLTLWKRN